MIKEKIEALKKALQKKESQIDIEGKVVKMPGKKEEEKTTEKDQQDKV